MQTATNSAKNISIVQSAQNTDVDANEGRDSMVSVITSCFNSADYISDTIESVCNQSYKNWEMIIVDDNSSDNSVEIIKQYSAKNPKIRLIQLPKNSGAAIARNTAIEAARGRFIAFLDSDDLWHFRKLEKQLLFTRSHGHAFTFTYYQKIYEGSPPIRNNIYPPKKLSYRDMLKKCHVGCLTAIYDTKQVGKVYMPLIRSRQDYALWLEILKKTEYAYCLEEPLAIYRVRSSSLSSSKLKLVKYNWSVFRNLQGLSRLKSLYYLSWNVVNKLLDLTRMAPIRRHSAL